MKIILLFIGAVIILIGLFRFFTPQTPIEVKETAQATSSSEQSLVAGAGPTVNSPDISCNFTSTIVTNEDGSQQAKLDWNVTPGTEVYIKELGDYVDFNSSGSVVSPVLRKISSYSAVVTTGFATSTCQVSAKPTSFSQTMPSEEIKQ